MEPAENKNSGNKGTFVATGVACSVIGAILGAVGLYWWQKEQKQPHQQHHSRPEKIYNKNDTCSICLGEMEEITVLPCGHQLHTNCSNRLKSSQPLAQCPLCRKTISD